jgi:RNA polymerase subunit RPABC4/transcription elongation factor Spt4
VVGLQALARSRDEVASRQGLLLRGNRLLWYVDVGGDDGASAVLRTVSLDGAFAVLEAFLTPPDRVARDARGARVPAGAGAEARQDACDTCGASLSATAKFCPACGTRVPRPQAGRCPGCGREVRATARFCRTCGASLRPDTG